MVLDTDAYHRALDNLYDGMYIVDRDRVIRYWNRAAERISGFSAAEVIGKSCADDILTHVDDNGHNLCKGKCPLTKILAEGLAHEAEVFLHHKNGHRVPVSVRVSPLTGADGEIIGAVELFFDISTYSSTGMKLKELEEMALLDNLTRLANRHFLEKEFVARFEEHGRFGTTFGVLFLDIDHFKKFNDNYGHDMGDQVLKFVADTLVRNLRPFDLVGRWGGEEFICIMRNVDLQQLEQLGNRLRLLVESSYLSCNDEKLQVTISAGGTLVHNDDSLDMLLKRADKLLYQSKSQGRNRVTVG